MLEPITTDEGPEQLELKVVARLYGEEDFAAYLVALRTRYPVKINRSLLEGK